MILQGSFFSTALDMETGIGLVCANRYSKHPRRVVYLLHGLQGRYDDFLHYTVLPDLCRDYDCLFVLPDGQRSFYSDMAVGGQYFTYLTEELPRAMADLFRVSAAPEDTFILGASMGGYGALKAALTYPERYAACGAFSPCCLNLENYLRNEWRDGSDGDAFRRIFGNPLKTDFDAAFGEGESHRAQNDLLLLAQKNANAPQKPRIYTCWGEKDLFADTNRPFPQTLQALGWDAHGEEVPGMMHNWVFFNEALKRTLPLCVK